MAIKQHLISLGSTTIGLGLLGMTCVANPALAADPFRTSNPKPIGNQTEAAFNALFKDGNYVKANELVQKAEAKEGSEPLLYGIKAILAFNNNDLSGFASAAKTTREKGEQLVSKDKLRGNLYASVGSFLEGAVIVKRDGLVKGAPAALGKVQEAFKKLDEAEKVDSKDPELNLVKGAIDLALAVNVKLPLSDSSKAIARLESTAGPRYIADRSLAWGYRDLKDQVKAMAAVDRALSVAKDNPELHYLKAQIFVRQGNDKMALDWLKKAVAKETQLPKSLFNEIDTWRKDVERRLETQAKAATPAPSPSSSPMKK